jgi:hypothetical protein
MLKKNYNILSHRLSDVDAYYSSGYVISFFRGILLQTDRFSYVLLQYVYLSLIIVAVR